LKEAHKLEILNRYQRNRLQKRSSIWIWW